MDESAAPKPSPSPTPEQTDAPGSPAPARTNEPAAPETAPSPAPSPTNEPAGTPTPAPSSARPPNPPSGRRPDYATLYQRQQASLQQPSNQPELLELLGGLRVMVELASLELTIFLLVGAESCGKSTLVERFLGFPITKVTHNIGTKRPLQVNIKPARKPRYTIRDGPSGNHEEVPQDQIQSRITLLNDVPTISNIPIILDVEGPDYQLAFSFIDLPGYQVNAHGEEKEKEKELIQNILVEMLKNPNALVILVGNSEPFSTNPTITALQDIETKIPQIANRSTFVVNKSDVLFASDALNEFEPWVCPFVAKFNAFPLFVGSSRPNSGPSRDQMTHEDIVSNYRAADAAEVASIEAGSKKLAKSPISSDQFKKLCGFDLLKNLMINLITTRDSGRIREFKGKIVDLLQQKKTFKKDLEDAMDGNDQPNFGPLLIRLISIMEQVAYAHSGHAQSKALSNSELKEDLGLTIEEEEELLDSIVFPLPTKTRRKEIQTREVIDQWEDFRESFRPPEGHSSPTPKEYLGSLFDRAARTFACMIYEFLDPEPKDCMERLANAVGSDPTMHCSQMVAPARKVVESYAEELHPCIEYFKRKTVFLLDRMLAASIYVLVGERKYARVILTIGKEAFQDRLHRSFRQYIVDRAEKVGKKAYSDLENLLIRLFPSGNESIARSMLKCVYGHKAVKNATPAVKKFTTPDNKLTAFADGINDGFRLISSSCYDFYTQLLIDRILENADDGEINTPGDDNTKAYLILPATTQESLQAGYGLFVVMLGEFLPNFIDTIVARFRGSLWGCLSNDALPSYLEKGLDDPEFLALRKQQMKTNQEALQEMTEHIAQLEDKLDYFRRFETSLAAVNQPNSKPPRNKASEPKGEGRPVKRANKHSSL